MDIKIIILNGQSACPQWRFYHHSVFVFLQLDPPDCRLLYLKSASVTFLNHEVWTASSAQQGRYLRILYSQCVIENICTLSGAYITSLTALCQIFWRTLWRRCQLEYSGNSNATSTQWGCRGQIQRVSLPVSWQIYNTEYKFSLPSDKGWAVQKMKFDQTQYQNFQNMKYKFKFSIFWHICMHA